MLGAQCCLFQNSRINNCQVPTPCPLGIEGPPPSAPGTERYGVDSQVQKQHEEDLVPSLWKLLIFPFSFSSSGKAAGFEE